MCKLLFILALFFGLTGHSQQYFMMLKQNSTNNGYAAAITIDHTKVPNTDQTNFPVLFTGTYTDLKSVSNGGFVLDAYGLNNIYFAATAGGTPLSFEITRYDATTGFIEAWIKTTVTTASDKVIYIMFGNPAITTFQGGSVGSAWDANFLGVYHGNDVITADGQTLTDATSNAANFQSRVSFGSWGQSNPVTGKIGYGQEINPTGGGYDNSYRRSSNFALTGAYTIEAWVKPIGTLGSGHIVFGDTSVATWTHFFGGQYRIDISASTKITSANTTTAGTWYHLALTRSGTTFTLYENGVQTATNANGQNININAFGARSGDPGSNNIQYDEIRLSQAARSADWLLASYNNQNSPSTFYTVGTKFAL